MLDLPNHQIEAMATTQDNANAWVQDNILNFPNVKFKPNQSQNPSPPSQGSFNTSYLPILVLTICFLFNNNLLLLVNLYPYFSYVTTRNMGLDYAIFTGISLVGDGQHNYQNLFDAMLDVVYSTLENRGGGSLEIVVSRTGWPTDGGEAATIDNARTYNNNLNQHVKQGIANETRKAY
ncbi:unnamed protein product [Citrullus colocynthis]|uniref:glucan endo-1,3-beta-D-glucosidase n=1 Tax=Citrullus colocynthis TaxID=252529 RepID=A0ABP0XTW9_9ROSI